jgi:uncharacterized protein (TIGR03067 family)
MRRIFQSRLAAGVFFAVTLNLFGAAPLAYAQQGDEWPREVDAREIKTDKKRFGPVLGLAFSKDGTRVVAGGFDSKMHLWDTGTGKQLVEFTGHTLRVNSVAFSADGKLIISGSGDNTVRVWDAATGRQTLLLKGHTKSVGSVAISTDGKYIASASGDKSARVWDANTGRQLLELKGHTEPVYSVCISGDGKLIVTGSYDRTVRVWDATTGRQTLELTGHTAEVNCVAFTPDDKQIVSGSGDSSVRTWDTATGKQTLEINKHRLNVGSVAVADSKEGRWIVSGSWDDTVRLWDAATGKMVLRLSGQMSQPHTVAISANGKYIAAAGHDGIVRIWDTTTARLPPGPKPKDTKGDSARLQGVWQVVQFTDPSLKPLPKEELIGHTFEFKGETVTQRRGKNKTGLPGNLTVDKSMNPMWIDLDFGMKTQGIYKVDGDELILCLVAGMLGGKVTPRPTEFQASASPPHSLIVLKRVKQDVPPKP